MGEIIRDKQFKRFDRLCLRNRRWYLEGCVTGQLFLIYVQYCWIWKHVETNVNRIICVFLAWPAEYTWLSLELSDAFLLFVWLGFTWAPLIYHHKNGAWRSSSFCFCWSILYLVEDLLGIQVHWARYTSPTSLRMNAGQYFGGGGGTVWRTPTPPSVFPRAPHLLPGWLWCEWLMQWL